ncbi:cysteine peptidase family C39 domain-containing protein [Gimesia aquarii]|uniref:Peptidase C39 domain-containing protein n=1 Tax=Gimesia aquarii TaxID=2527964 RepID=A0A517VXT9_9PLAN|nr:cysteine peptidase family C39 domain-containing protein [Gimesia aquarii]QDT97816.1 hypothetical protein V144x_32980 [Gimesia aquarii]
MIRNLHFLILLIAILKVTLVVAEEQSINAVIDTIAQSEKNVQNFQYKMTTEPHTVIYDGSKWIVNVSDKDTNPGKSLFPGMFQSASEVTFESSNSQFHATYDVLSESKDPEGKNLFSNREMKYAYDGSQFMQLRLEHLTKELPDWQQPPKNWKSVYTSPPAGIIDLPQNQSKYIQDNLSFMESTAVNCGIGWVTPFVYSMEEPIMKLSDLLQLRLDEGEQVIFQQTTEGLWDIHFGLPYGFRIFYDPVAGRIDKSLWGACIECPVEGGPKFKNMTFTNFAQYYYADSKSLIPNQVIFVKAFGKKEKFVKGRQESGLVMNFTDQALNQNLNENDFRIKFTKGTVVRDYINKKIYTEGDDSTNDVEATQKFLAYHNLLDDSGQRRVGQSPPKRNQNLILINLGILFVILIIIIFLRWKHRKNIISSILLFGSLCLCSSSYADDELSHQHEKRCGQLVTIATLQLYGIEANADLIQQELKVGKRGINLSRIQRVLSAYGIRVIGRKGLDLADYKKYLNKSRIAIVPVAINDKANHYVLLLRRVKDGKLVVVDPLKFVVPVADKANKVLTSMDGICLICEGLDMPHEEYLAQLKKNVSFDKTIINVGDLSILRSQEKPKLHVELSVSNRSNRPVLLDQFKGTCGCLSSSIPSCIIDANSTISMEAIIEKSAWGRGIHSKFLSARYQGEPIAHVEIRANGVQEIDLNGLMIKPEKIEVELSDNEWSGNASLVSGTPLSIRGDDRILDTISVSSSHDWMIITPKRISSDILSMTPQVSVTDKLKRLLRDSSSRVRSTLSIEDSFTSKKTEVPVFISRESTYFFKPTVVSIKPGETTTSLSLHSLSVRNSLEKHLPKITITAPAFSGSTLNSKLHIENGVIRVNLDIPEQMRASRTLLLRVKIEGTNSIDAASTVLRIES